MTLYCVHKWPVLFSQTPTEIRDYEPPKFKICLRCDGYWKDGDPEPEVAIARTKESIHVL